MADFFEIDFLDVETKKSGDAIALRYEIGGFQYVHVVDAGYQDTGHSLCAHIKKYYGDPVSIDHVVVTHPDGDHAAGIPAILESFQVDALWMLRPWIYADELLPRFERYTNKENLAKRLRELYPTIAYIEELALEKGIPIHEPLQGKAIGAFNVLSPSRDRYLDLVVSSDRTPEAVTSDATMEKAGLFEAIKRVVVAIAEWGLEKFSANETSAENEMSVVQHATLCDETILLTGDAGRGGLTEAADYTPVLGITLPGVKRFQVPHHGSRRNVSTEVLDRWLGPKLAQQPAPGHETFTAIVSSAKEDPDHPRKAVVRAMIHRGARVVTTEGQSIRTSKNAPNRDGWSAVTPVEYPNEQED